MSEGHGAPSRRERSDVILQFTANSVSGWGVYAINLALHWARDAEIDVAFSTPVDERQIVVDPLRMSVLATVLARSRDLAAALQPHAGRHVRLPGAVLHALGDRLEGGRSVHDVALRGDLTVGTVFFEHTTIDAAAHERARQYDLIVTGSTWNRQVLERNGIGPPVTVLQGVDPTLFHVAPRSGLYDERFIVFSGGKLEVRKGQDLVLVAFKAFASRHPEALLVTAWHSPWPRVARGFQAGNSKAGPVPFTDRETPDIRAWAAANGVAPERVVDLGALPNLLMPSIMREAHAAVFPNRCEGGTNLVAMECMACGVPTLLSANTGHLDLVDPARCFPLGRQSAIPTTNPEYGTDDWGESDVEEIVEVLETVWRDRNTAAAVGAAGARFMSQLTWANQTRQLKETILPYLS